MGTQSENITNELSVVVEMDDEDNDSLLRIANALSAENALKRKIEENPQTPVGVKQKLRPASPSSNNITNSQKQAVDIVTPTTSGEGARNSPADWQVNNSQNSNNNYTPLNQKSVDNYYISSDKGPFVVYIENKNKQFIHAMSIGKFIRDCCFNIYKDIISINKINKFRIKLILNTYENANKLTHSPIWETKNLIAFIPNFSISRQGVIRDIDISLTEEDIIYYADSEQQILKARRITKKDKNNPEYRINTPVVIITFRGQTLPSEIKILGVICKVESFIQKVVLCFHCLRYGHISDHCISDRRCERCGQKHEYSCQDCLAPLYCVHCGENHKSTDIAVCVEFKNQSNIKNIMADRNLPFLEAKIYQKNSSVEKEKTYAEQVLSDSQQFPPLAEALPRANKNIPNLKSKITNANVVNKYNNSRNPPPLKVHRSSPNFELPKNTTNNLNIPQAPILNTPQYNNSLRDRNVDEKENLIRLIYCIIQNILNTQVVKNNEITSENIHEIISTSINTFLNTSSENK